jgi:hypothetical protein
VLADENYKTGKGILEIIRRRKFSQKHRLRNLFNPVINRAKQKEVPLKVMNSAPEEAERVFVKGEIL